MKIRLYKALFFYFWLTFIVNSANKKKPMKFVKNNKIAEKPVEENDADFEQLMKEHLKPIYNFLFQIVRDSFVAEDLTQDSFVKAWRNMKSFDAKKSFKTWIFTIAKNTAYDYLRKKKSLPFSFFKKNEEESGLEEIKEEGILPDEILEKEDLAKELEEKLRKIPRKYRTILYLHYKEDFSLHEISEIVKKPYNTVKSLHSRALIRLRKAFLDK